MSVLHNLLCEAPVAARDEAQRWFRSGPAARMAAMDTCERCDLYLPQASHDPYLDDGQGPAALLQTRFADQGALEQAIADSAFSDSCKDGDAITGLSIAHQAFEVREYPVAGAAEAVPLEAPVSYVVRYFRPSEDEQAFIDYYCTSHPPLLGKLPGIRNIYCYVPITWADASGIDQIDYLFGNEVVFDSLDALNAALASEIRDELREDFHNFPKFAGDNPHHAMLRERLA